MLNHLSIIELIVICYVLGCIDGSILATLAFILATRHVRLQPEPLYQSSTYKGRMCIIHSILIALLHYNYCLISKYLDGVSIGGSRKSLNLQPVLLVAPPHHNGDDSVSQFSNRTMNRYGRPDYHNSIHQFQL